MQDLTPERTEPQLSINLVIYSAFGAVGPSPGFSNFILFTWLDSQSRHCLPGVNGQWVKPSDCYRASEMMRESIDGALLER